MIDDYTLIADLFGKRRSEARPAESRTSTIVGVATSNSVDGSVRVRIDGDLTGGEDGELTVPTEAHVLEGDVVSISLVGGTAKAPRVTGTVGGGDRTYDYAATAHAAATRAVADAEQAREAAESAATDARSAAQSAEQAATSAESAEASATQAEGSASAAQASASNAQASAGQAATAASDAQTSAGQAAASAQDAASEAATAKQRAQEANTAANEAKDSAAAANTAANDALVQVSTVEDVIGTVNWITEHGTYSKTTDAQVDDSKVYYTRTGSGTTSDPYVYTAVAEPTQSGLSSYYELSIDQALSQFVSTHLALTDAGLYVLADANGYKLLITNSSVQVIDTQGHVVTTYGENITFDSSRRQYIGNEDAFILFTPATSSAPASIQIGGGNVTIGGKAPSDLLTSLDISTQQTSTGADITVAGQTVHLANGAKGDTGPQGPAGTSVTISKVEYATSTTESQPSSGWSTTAPSTVAEGSWLWVKTTYSDSTTSVTRAKQGKSGTNGTSYYTHVRYSESADGTGHVASPTSATKYIGVYTGTSSSAPSSKTSYKWSKYVGEDGAAGHSPAITTSHSGTTTTIYADGTAIGTVEDGEDGTTPTITASKSGTTTTVKVNGTTVATIADGTSVKVSKVEYGTSSTASTTPSSWSTTVPTSIAQGKWLWVKTTYTDNSTATTKSYIGTDGEDGKSVAIKSATKADGVTTVVLEETDGTTTTTKTLTIADGEDGANGQPGANGASSYVHTAWANSADGTTDFSTTVSANKKYLGVYTDSTQADSTSPSAYSWSLIKGDTGAQGPQGPQGEQGVSVTNVTSTNNTADGGTSVVTVTLSDGTTKTFNVKNGSKGNPGATGATAQWYYGEALTHTSGTATLSTSSTSGVVVGSMYLNTATSKCYKCTAISGSTATWTYAGDLTEGVIDNIDVGGRNLLVGSAMLGKSGSVHGWINNGGTPSLDVVDGISCIKVTSTVANAYIASARTSSRVNLEWGQTYIASCWLMFNEDINNTFGDTVPLHFHAGSVATTDVFDLAINGKGGGVSTYEIEPDASYGSTIPANTWVRFVRKIVTNATAPNADYPYPVFAPFVYGSLRKSTTSTEHITWIRDFKVEKGNVATDWTPAPEDAVDEDQLVYIQAASVSSVPTLPTSWVEETGESIAYGTQGDASTITTVWTTKHPTYDRNRPVTFVATQRRTVGGTVTCTQPLPDDTATVIDGGNIITNSIQAHALESNSLKLSNFSDEVTGKFTGYDKAADDVGTLSGNVKDLSDKVATFEAVEHMVTSHDGQLTTIMNTLKFNEGELELKTQSGSDSTSVALTSTKLAFRSGNSEVASISNEKLDIENAEVHGTLAFGGFAFIPRSNGNLSLKWIGA